MANQYRNDPPDSKRRAVIHTAWHSFHIVFKKQFSFLWTVTFAIHHTDHMYPRILPIHTHTYTYTPPYNLYTKQNNTETTMREKQDTVVSVQEIFFFCSSRAHSRWVVALSVHNIWIGYCLLVGWTTPNYMRFGWMDIFITVNIVIPRTWNGNGTRVTHYGRHYTPNGNINFSLVQFSSIWNFVTICAFVVTVGLGFFLCIFKRRKKLNFKESGFLCAYLEEFRRALIRRRETMKVII